jgi:hypothetical protein
MQILFFHTLLPCKCVCSQKSITIWDYTVILETRLENTGQGTLKALWLKQRHFENIL